MRGQGTKGRKRLKDDGIEVYLLPGSVCCTSFGEGSGGVLVASDDQVFTARVYKVGINPCVDVPARVSRAFAPRRGYVPVEGDLEGFPIRANLVSVGGGRHRLYLNGGMRQGAGVDTGDRVRIRIRFDPKPRRERTPTALRDALARNQRAQAAWQRLTPSKRKEILLYLNSLKSAEALDRNVRKVIARLREGSIP